MDIAEIGFKADTKDLKTANRELDRLAGSSRRAETATEKLNREFERQKRMMGTLGNAVRQLQGALAAVGAALLVRSITRAADGYQLLQGRLRLVTASSQELATVSQQLFEIAQRTRAPIQGVSDLYIKLATVSKELGVSQQQLLGFTEAVGNALTLSGTSAGTATAALMQLSQAVGGGIVRAEEFNSILEGAPVIIQTVAKNLDAAGGSVAKLRKLVNDGSISSRAFFDAFIEGANQLSVSAQTIPRTVGQALTQLDNEFFRTLGTADTSPIIKAIDELRERVKDPGFQTALVETANGIAQLVALLARAGAYLGGVFSAFDRPETVDRLEELTGGIARLRSEIEAKQNGGLILKGFGRDVEAELQFARSKLEEFEGERIVAARKLINSVVPQLPKLNADVPIPLRLPELGSTTNAQPLASDTVQKQSAAQKMIEQLEEQLLLTDDLTLSEQVRIKLANEMFGVVTASEAKQLQALADLASAREEDARLLIEQREQVEELNRIYAETRTPIEAAAIEQEKLNKLLELGVGNAEAIRRKIAQVQIAPLQTGVDQVLADFERAQQAAAAGVQIGDFSGSAGQTLVRDAAMSATASLKTYREQLALLASQSAPEAQAALQRLDEQLRIVEQSTLTGTQKAIQSLRLELANLDASFAQGVASATTSNLADFFRNIGDESTTASEKVKAFVAGLAGSVADLAAQVLATQATLKLFETFGGVLSATGNPDPAKNGAAGAAYAAPILAASTALTTSGGILTGSAVSLSASAKELAAAAIALAAAQPAGGGGGGGSGGGGGGGLGDILSLGTAAFSLFSGGGGGGAGGGTGLGGARINNDFTLGEGPGLFSGLFGGSMDQGGMGMPGKAYAIGKGAQPELFIPQTAGQFVPRDQWQQQPAPPPQVNTKIVNAIDPKMLIDSMASPDGEQVILNVINRNASKIRSVTGGR